MFKDRTEFTFVMLIRDFFNKILNTKRMMIAIICLMLYHLPSTFTVNKIL